MQRPRLVASDVDGTLLDPYARVTVGDPRENDVFLAAARSFRS